MALAENHIEPPAPPAEAKTDAKAEGKTEGKSEAGTDAAKIAAATETKTEAKIDGKIDAQAKAQAETKVEANAAAKAAPQREPRAGGVLTVDLAAIEANWRTLAQRLVTVECGAVVKANAYGLGIEQVTTTLVHAGCKTFFVADLAEARQVRARAPEAVIYVLNGFSFEGTAGYLDINARPVINSMMELAEWDALVAVHNWRGGAALQVDTGMKRLGISAEDAAALAQPMQTKNHGITLLMSHLACAEVADHPLTASQIQLFREIRMLFPNIPASLANSSGIFLGDSAHYDVARPGAALYGVNPTPGKPNPMHGVVELTGRILQMRRVERGETVGYGATWTAKRDSQLAVVALGYADGLPRAASGTDNTAGAQAIIAGRQCPFAGRVSMDLVCIDITDLPNGAIRRGDVTTFIGGGLSVDDLAATANTIGYEVLTRLGASCPVVYRGMPEITARETAPQDASA